MMVDMFFIFLSHYFVIYFINQLYLILYISEIKLIYVILKFNSISKFLENLEKKFNYE